MFCFMGDPNNTDYLPPLVLGGKPPVRDVQLANNLGILATVEACPVSSVEPPTRPTAHHHAGDKRRSDAPLASPCLELLTLPEASAVCKEIRERAEEHRVSLGRLHKRLSNEESRVLAHLHGIYSPIARRGE